MATDLQIIRRYGIVGTLAAGKHVKIETSPAGEEIADEVVPVGKKWAIQVVLHIDESDA